MPEEIPAFSRVDASTSSRSLVEFLDHTAVAHFNEINRRSIELLRLREGAAALDVGCGTGDDVRMMREVVGPRGCVTGIDLSRRMIDEAIARDQASTLHSRFVVGDVQDLPFADGCFDACRISRVLLHVADAELALKEVVRVTRAGGTVVAIEPDFGTMALAHPDHETTQTVLNSFCDSFAHGTVGRWLTVWFQSLGMKEIRCEPRVLRIDADFLRHGFQIERAVQRASDLQLVTADRCNDFIRMLDEIATREEFFCIATVLMVSALKPCSTQDVNDKDNNAKDEDKKP
jgi:ubiquinone/menaquinone biosynthesis C-methylase UbiE